MEKGVKNMNRAVSEAMSDVTAACISTTLVFMAVFLPVTFMSGTAGTFFKQFGITMASAVGLSAVSALTLCPALCAFMLSPKSDEEKKRKNLNYYMRVAYSASYDALLKKYMNAVNLFIHRQRGAWIALAIAVLSFGWLMTHSQNDLVPQEDQGFLLVNVALKPGTYLNRTEATTVQLEKYIQSLDEVETVGALTGYSMMDDVTSTNYATLMVRLKNWDERSFFSIADIQTQITEWANINLPQADITAFQMPQIPGYGNGSNINLNLQDRARGDNKDEFIAMSREFIQKLNERPEIDDAASHDAIPEPPGLCVLRRQAAKAGGAVQPAGG
jgi:multidrug efflux pump subunit AcrB